MFWAQCTKTTKKLRKSLVQRKPFIWSQDKIITKFGPKNEQVGAWAKCTKTTQKIRKSVIYGTYFEQGNINRKPLIQSEDMIITKFRQKKIGEFGFWKSLRKLPKN